MNAPQSPDWTDANQSMLAVELAWLRRRLETMKDGQADDGGDDLERAAAATPSAIDIICAEFGLSTFERRLLLLCCGVELDAGISAACGRWLGADGPRNPTFGLALAALPDAHWSALTPARPLRRWRMVEPTPGLRLVDAPLCVDERILHFVAGINALDARLRPSLTPLDAASLMSDQHAALAARIADRIADGRSAQRHVALEGDDARGQQDVAAAAATRLGMQAFVLRSEDVPTAGPEFEQLQVLWEREARLLPALLLLQATEQAPSPAFARFADGMQAPLVLASRDALRLQRPIQIYTVDKPDNGEQKQLWRQALGERAASLNGSLDTLAGQFRFSANAIASIAESVSDGDEAESGLWRACQRSGRQRLDDLAERIRPSASWGDLVLPPAQLNALKQIGAHLRHRIRVYEDWGFASRYARGLGIGALFSGESGTGKTLAADVLAGDLGLDLYRIDLSSVVSKYIGETEKNLRRVFDAAEDSGAILLFDEADALFGKRSEVKDSHDRYANIEISYLLQRMEDYRGLAILTTNMKAALDRAFQRRLRFVVNFPFPDSALREAIWRRAFPLQAPRGTLDYPKLAKLNLPGGNIRNIALNAAFLAAEAGAPVGMAHLLQAAQSESGKLERPLADAETRGWL